MTLQLDANGLPIGHTYASQEAAQALADLINELPGSVYHMGHTDAEWATSQVLLVYVQALRKVQRPAAAAVAGDMQGRLVGWIHGDTK